MTDEKTEIMGRHVAYWQPVIDPGRMVIFGPVVTTGTASVEIGKMLAGFVRTL